MQFLISTYRSFFYESSSLRDYNVNKCNINIFISMSPFVLRRLFRRFISSNSKFRSTSRTRERHLIIALILTCMHGLYKVSAEVIHGSEIGRSPLSAANREPRSDSHSIDRSLHSVCRRSFRGEMQLRIHKRPNRRFVHLDSRPRMIAWNQGTGLICVGRLQYTRDNPTTRSAVRHNLSDW